MKRNFIFFSAAIIFLWSHYPANAQPTTLSPGDIAFTGYNSDDNTINGATANDDISFILLRNINSGTVIYFTDFGWLSDLNAFQTANPCGGSTGAVTDGVVQWTATSNMTYGTQVYIRCKVSPTANVGTAIGSQTTASSPSEYMTLATGGDQVFAFQGTLASPTLIAGMNMNGAFDAALSQCTFTASSSSLPTALSTNNYAFAITPEVDNARLKSTVALTGNAATDRAAIHNPANWDVSDLTAFALPAPGVGLPVTFLSFSVLHKNESLQLTWKVADEYQLESYRVERSADGWSWKEIGKVPAAGNSYYNWTDPHADKNRMHYRIRSVDLDGSYQLSQVVTTMPVEAITWQMKVFPNPASSYADVRIVVPQTVRARLWLVNTAGKIVWQQQTGFLAGVHVLRLYDLKKLAAGTYLLHLQTPERSFRHWVNIVK